MFKFLKISLLSVLLLTNVFINAENQSKNVEAMAMHSAAENSTQEAQQAAQPNLVALSKEESQALLQNLSKEESELLNKFLEALTKKLESLKDEVVVSEMAEAFAAKGISWNVTLSVYPCKQELKIVESAENDMLLNS
jgi:hypothetical protein